MAGLSRAEIFGITAFSILAAIWLGQVTYGTITHSSTKALKKTGNELPVREVSSTITVHVAGAVKKPGVLKMPAGSRISEAIELAGGTLANADTSLLNLAESLTDGQKISIPFKDEIIPATTQNGLGKTEPHPSTYSGAKFPINLNTATMEELMALPDIGEVRAKDIITYRNEHNGFKKKEDITNVKGIGKGIFDKIKDLIYI